MFGIGISEIAILLIILLAGLVMLGGLFAVVYFAVRSGARKDIDQDQASSP